jgi:hypothetical protein
MRVLFTMQLCALGGCLLAAPGCGEEDEQRRPPLDWVERPGLPPHDCTPAQSSTLTLSEQTTFGENALDMLGAVLPAGDMIPFFWVGYDDLDAPVSYSPGVSETLLRLSIAPREDAVVQQSITPPTDDPCEKSHIEFPVHVALETADGALAETFDSDVSFEQRDVASLYVELRPDAIRGGLALEPTGALAAGWQLRKLGIGVSLWRGGTSGAVDPSFVKPAPTPETATPPLRTGPQASERSREGLAEGPGIPLHWSSLAVWPRRERCAEGLAVDADERRFGWSPRDALAALAERASLSLVTEAGATPVRATFEEPPGLVCMAEGAGEGQMGFSVPGRLAAESATAGSPLEQLALSSSFRVSAKSAVDDSGITDLNWERWVPDVTTIAENREAFAASTGLALDAADHYQLFWWTSSAEQHRTAPSDPWQGSGEVLVFGADGFREISVGTGAFEGETPPPPMTFRTLEGDTLLHASFAP